jgi:hypothetical protein
MIILGQVLKMSRTSVCGQWAIQEEGKVRAALELSTY